MKRRHRLLSRTKNPAATLLERQDFAASFPHLLREARCLTVSSWVQRVRLHPEQAHHTHSVRTSSALWMSCARILGTPPHVPVLGWRLALCPRSRQASRICGWYSDRRHPELAESYLCDTDSLIVATVLSENDARSSPHPNLSSRTFGWTRYGSETQKSTANRKLRETRSCESLHELSCCCRRCF